MVRNIHISRQNGGDRNWLLKYDRNGVHHEWMFMLWAEVERHVTNAVLEEGDL